MNLSHIQRNAEEIFHKLRWNNGKSFQCPFCGSIHITSKDINHHHCNSCNRYFSDTSNTIFHSTKLPLWKWLTAIYYFLSTPHGISSYTLSKYISVSQPTAWRMQMLLRTHLRQQIELSDEIILDEVYLGAEWKWVPTYTKMRKLREMEKRMRLENPRWVAPLDNERLKCLNYRCAADDKMIVLGIRDYKARKLELLYIPTLTGERVVELIKTRNKGISRIITDQSRLYGSLPFKRSICNHGKGQYKSADGYSSNPIENHFSHLRRTWHGTYQWFSKKYIQGYLDEFAFRYNYRNMKLIDKFSAAFCLIITGFFVILKLFLVNLCFFVRFFVVFVESF